MSLETAGSQASAKFEVLAVSGLQRLVQRLDLVAVTLFASATSEAHAPSADAAAAACRAWLRGTLTMLASQAGAADPETLGRQLHALWDGAVLSVRMDRDQRGVRAIRAAAALLDAALPTAGSPVRLWGRSTMRRRALRSANAW